MFRPNVTDPTAPVAVHASLLAGKSRLQSSERGAHLDHVSLRLGIVVAPRASGGNRADPQIVGRVEIDQAGPRGGQSAAG